MERSKVVTMNSQPDKRNLLTVDQAWDEVFERSISKTKLYQMLQQGLIPCAKIGAKYLLRRDTLEVWFQKQEQNCQ
ncbi:helix-turn-helix domain-containing protein [uncultured Brevibacillus sp.]|uniref:helix-turn-helix domain-containing protein n=1 Tax=uncultured Brevibacillus sp. TaxID=169970 RepID=UPI002598D0A7|nr:helix-turn-helix domain-containing protein [uncultured Brevibacillus sp.]